MSNNGKHRPPSDGDDVWSRCQWLLTHVVVPLAIAVIAHWPNKG